MLFKPYMRKAQFYETDQMGIIHHANYVHWMEEARVDYMDQMGFSYQRTEECGISIAVLGVHCTYKRMVRFGDMVRIHCFLESLSPVRMTVGYRMEDAATGEIKTVCQSEHCFINKQGRPDSLIKTVPELYALFARAMDESV